MGIFVKFECAKCGQYECDCSLEERKGTATPNNTPLLKKGNLTEGDIVKRDHTKHDAWVCTNIDGELKGVPILTKRFTDETIIELTDDLIRLANATTADLEKYKYFAPSREDIFIGYECEFKFRLGIQGYEWRPITVFETDLNLFLRDIKMARTPYLTKEQIEKEGWIDKSHVLNVNSWAFEKGNRFAVIRTIDLENPFVLEIIIKDPSKEPFVFGLPSEHFRFICPCPSINEFRKICKLLGI